MNVKSRIKKWLDYEIKPVPKVWLDLPENDQVKGFLYLQIRQIIKESITKVLIFIMAFSPTMEYISSMLKLME